MMKIGRRASRRRYAWLAASPLAASAVVGGAVALFVAMQPALAATAPVGLGTAASFGVLAGSTVTNTGPSVIAGNLGVYPGTAVTGFPPGAVTGTVYTATGPGTVAMGAQADLTVAYNDAAGRSPTAHVPATIGSAGIDKAPLVPGVYQASSSLEVSGALTLNAGGNPSAVWIFQAPSTLLTDPAGSSVVLTNGAQACNVFWQVGSSATLSTGTAFQGTILALTSITVDTGDTITGRALARNGAVTLDDDTINVPSCTTGIGPTVSPTSASPTGVPTSASPTGVPTSASPTGVPTSASPTGVPTSAGPTRMPPSPGPTGTSTSPGPTAAPTSTGSSGSPPSSGPTAAPPSPGPAPTPSPIRTPFPVTG
jgi:Ice-binding-like